MRVWCSVPYGLGFRNLVVAGVVSACVQKGARVRLLLPSLHADDIAVLRQEIPAGVEIEALLPVAHGPWFTALKALKQHHYAVRTRLESFAIRRKRRRFQQPVAHALATPFEWVGERVVPESVVDFALTRTPQPHEASYGRAMDRDRPDVLAVTKPGYMPEELPLIRAARARGIPVVAVDTTWDNMASKRPPYLPLDRLTVWNAWMAGEATSHYAFTPDGVRVTGGTQFDVLFDADRLEGREAFLHRLGLDPARRLVVFASNGPTYSPDNAGYISMLVRAMRSGAIAGAPNFIVRTHPFDLAADYGGALEGYPNGRVERPFAPSRQGSVYECLPTKAAVEHFGALMRHADVLINQASTTSLDAMATDTPVVNIAFDSRPTHPDNSISRVYGFTHYKRIVDTGAVTLTHSEDALYETLTRYLASPELNRAERLAARQAFLTFADGASAARVAQAILQ